MCIAFNCFSQVSMEDSIKSTKYETVIVKPLEQRNHHRRCFRENKQVLDTLKNYYNIRRTYSNYNVLQNECLFGSFLTNESEIFSSNLSNIASYLFEYKTFIILASSVQARGYIEDKYFASILGVYILENYFLHNCDYFNNITDDEKQNSNSGFRIVINQLFAKNRDSLKLNVKDIKNDCFLKNISLIENSLDIRAQYLNERK